MPPEPTVSAQRFILGQKSQPLELFFRTFLLVQRTQKHVQGELLWIQASAPQT
jgi:hypothetical protein